MDNVTVRYFANFKRQVEATAKELARAMHQEPILELKYRGIPYSAK
jgi:molybdopterin converting factor small subunit